MTRTERNALPQQRFNQHRRAAKQRGVAFELSFDDWMRIWRDSGKWGQRGCGSGKYVMSRRGDVGAYAVGNVFIQSFEANVTEGTPRTRLGTGRGWTELKGKRGPSYQVVVGHRYVGTFKTVSEAENAYRNACLSFVPASLSTPLNKRAKG